MTDAARAFVRRIPFLAASGLIVLLLGMQVIAMSKGACSLRSHVPQAALFCAAPTPWPFMHYAMYSKAWREGDVLHRYRVIGILPDKREVPLSADDLGLNYWLYKDFVTAIRNGNEARFRDYIDAYASKHQVTLVGLRLESDPLMLSSGQLIQRPSEIITRVAVGLPEVSNDAASDLE